MSDAETAYPGFGRGDLLRWGLCFALVLALHGTVAAALMMRQDEGDVIDSAPAVTVDFIALPMPDAPLRDVAPGPEQMQAMTTPEVLEAEEKPEEERPEEEKPLEKAEIAPPVEEVVPMQEIASVQESEVALAVVKPPPPKKVRKKKKEEAKRRPTPKVVGARRTTAPTSATARSAAKVSWNSRIAAHLQRHKQYPAAAQARGDRGTVVISFSINREGRVLGTGLVRGSGHALLDREALDMVRRSQPFPQPTPDIAGSRFSFAVPVSFSVR